MGFVSRYVHYSSLRANFPIRSSDACAPLLPSFIACHGAQPERGYNTVLFFSFSCRSDWLYVMLYGEFSHYKILPTAHSKISPALQPLNTFFRVHHEKNPAFAFGHLPAY